MFVSVSHHRRLFCLFVSGSRSVSVCLVRSLIADAKCWHERNCGIDPAVDEGHLHAQGC